MLLFEERRAVMEYGKKMISSGLVKGSGGNISLCNADKTLLALSPSGVNYEDIEPKDVVVLNLEGEQVDGDLIPSSEISIHLDLLNLKREIRSVVHTHSTYATAVGCLGWELPALHYLIAHAGTHVPLAPYATFGTQALSDNVCSVIGDSKAVLMANHGLVAVGPSLEKAFGTAEMVEYIAQLYLLTKTAGEPVILTQGDMESVLEKFKTAGQKKSE